MRDFSAYRLCTGSSINSDSALKFSTMKSVSDIKERNEKLHTNIFINVLHPLGYLKILKNGRNLAGVVTYTFLMFRKPAKQNLS